MLLALIFVVRAAAAVSASLSDFESCGEFCDWIPYAGRVETDCRFSVRAGMWPMTRDEVFEERRLGPALEISSDDHVVVLQPHNATALEETVLCSFAGTPPSDFSLLLVANSVDYLFRLWPYFLQKVVWAEKARIPLRLWIGAFPEGLQEHITPECESSVAMRDWQRRRLKTSFYEGKMHEAKASNHHNKILATYVMLRILNQSVFYFDMDSLVSKSIPGNLVDIMLEPHRRGVVDALFENHRTKHVFWHTKSRAFYVRNTELGRRFVSAWMHWRCGFKDQYSLWHTTLVLGRRENCFAADDLAQPAAENAIFANFSYSEAVKEHSSAVWHRHGFEWLKLDCPTRQARCPNFRVCDDTNNNVSLDVLYHRPIERADVRAFYYYDNTFDIVRSFVIQDMFLGKRGRENATYLEDHGKELLSNLIV